MWKLSSIFFLIYFLSIKSAVSIPDFEGHENYCGRLTYPDADVVNNKENYEPWSVVIFNKISKTQPWKYFGEGILLSNSTVLITAELFIESLLLLERRLEIQPFENYLVVAGVKTKQFPIQFDEETEDYSEVSLIRIHEKATNPDLQNSIGIIHLRKPLEYNPPFINEICIVGVESPGDSLTFPDQIVTMGGFIQNDPLSKSQNDLTTRMRSQLVVKNQNFCDEKWEFYHVGKNQSGLQCAVPYSQDGHPTAKRCHQGTALTYSVPLNNHSQHFLAGVFLKHFEVIQSTNAENCTEHSVYFFLPLDKHIDWIFQNIRCGPCNFACSSQPIKCLNLHEVCNGNKDCPNGEDEDADYCENFKRCKQDEIQCGPLGQCISNRMKCDKKSDCPYVEHRQAFITQEVDTDSGESSCPPISVAEKTKCTCILPGSMNEKYDCSTGGIRGSKMIIECDHFYTSKEEVSKIETECLINGRWYPPVRNFSCKIECGRTNPKIQALIVHGWKSNSSTWPWHGMLGKINSDGVEYGCGVTLITDSSVLTAAHCIPTNDQGESDPSILEVVLGSSHSEFDYRGSPSWNTAQRFRVKNIAIPDCYSLKPYLECDIAVIHLIRKVNLTEDVRPVCFPFPGKISDQLQSVQLSHGVVGYVAGFGYDATGDIPSELQALGLPYISHSNCSESLGRPILLTQFCAGYKNGSGTCQGDSGGGIVFSEGTGIHKRFFIQGIVSNSNSEPMAKGSENKCNTKNYAVYTKVASFAQWIQDKITYFESFNN